jgi:ABC-2 type transport system permease protein
MITFEIARWRRSQRLLIVVLVFLFSGMTSPLIAAYSPEIFQSLGASSDMQITVADPSWQDLIASYFKNSSQLALLLAGYVAAWGCALGADDRLRLFYTSRVRRSSEIFLPRLAVSGTVVLVGGLVGGGVALYETVALVEGTDVSLALGALAVQAVGITFFALYAGLIACWTNSPFISAIVVTALVFAGSFVQSLPDVADWSPTILVSPISMLNNEGFDGLSIPLIVGLGVLVAGIVLVCVKKERVMSRRTQDTNRKAAHLLATHEHGGVK